MVAMGIVALTMDVQAIAQCLSLGDHIIAEPLGEQPIRFEGGSSPAFRTYFVRVNFTGTPVSVSELSEDCWGAINVLNLFVSNRSSKK